MENTAILRNTSSWFKCELEPKIDCTNNTSKIDMCLTFDNLNNGSRVFAGTKTIKSILHRYISFKMLLFFIN